MSILSASRNLQTLIDNHSRALLISSWAKKRYQSSFPVRYVPGYAQIKKAPNSPPLNDFDKDRAGLVQKNEHTTGISASQIPSFGSGEFRDEQFCDGTMQVSDLFKKVDELSDLEDATDTLGTDFTERDDAVCSKVKKDAGNVAIELLAARAFTSVELRKKLLGKKYPVNVVDSVLTDIKNRGLLNDGLYAESYSRSRWLSSTWGPRRIKQALFQKGISYSEAEKATKQVFENDDDPDGDGSQQTNHGMSKLSMDRLLVQASKQWLRGQDTSPENRKARIIRWLQYRGFSWGVTSFILRELQSRHPQ